MDKLEILLYKIVDKGWYIKGIKMWDKNRFEATKSFLKHNIFPDNGYKRLPVHRRVVLRFIISSDSGLWEIVTRKWLYDLKKHSWLKIRVWWDDYCSQNKRYRIMKSAIEDNISDFLLSNLKV